MHDRILTTTFSAHNIVLGGKVTCISFIENTHSIAAASDNGSIHIFRVHYISAGKYGKCEAVRKISLDDEFAVTMEHYHTGNNPSSESS